MDDIKISKQQFQQSAADCFGPKFHAAHPIIFLMLPGLYEYLTPQEHLRLRKTLLKIRTKYEKMLESRRLDDITMGGI